MFITERIVVVVIRWLFPPTISISLQRQNLTVALGSGIGRGGLAGGLSTAAGRGGFGGGTSLERLVALSRLARSSATELEPPVDILFCGLTFDPSSSESDALHASESESCSIGLLALS